MSLDDLERELYKKQQKNKTLPKEEKIPEESDIPHNWETIDIKSGNGFHVSRRSFTIGISIVILATLGAGALLFANFFERSNKNVDIMISAPKEVTRGVPFQITVNATNQLSTSLLDAVFELNLPQGIIPYSQDGTDIGRAIITKEAGEIVGGSLAKKTFTLVPVDEVGSVKKITASISYTDSRGSGFKNQDTADVTINKTPISLDLKGPDHALGGSTVDFTITYKNDSSFDFPDVALQVQYPPSFSYISADETPSALNNYWNIPSGIKSGAEKTITIKGRYEGSSDSQLVFPVTLSTTFSGNEYRLITQNLSIATAPSPISLTLSVNNKTDYVAHIGDILHYSIKYQNLSGIALSNVVIKTSLIGALFDIGTVNTKGSLDSISNTITWNASQIPSLKLLDPGASGELEVDVKLKSTFPTDRYSEKNFYVQFKTEFDSPSVPYYLSAKSTSVSSTLETRIGGAIFLDALAFYHDSFSGITNSGPFPPKVNTSTQYTIHWRIKNFATDVRDVTVTASLSPGVTWTGVVGGNTMAPTYNERTGEVTWTINKVSAMKGIFTDPIEVIFQIEARPNVTQTRNYMPLLSETIIKGTDDFTGIELVARDNPLTTELSDDKTIASGSGVVVP